MYTLKYLGESKFDLIENVSGNIIADNYNKREYQLNIINIIRKAFENTLFHNSQKYLNSLIGTDETTADVDFENGYAKCIKDNINLFFKVNQTFDVDIKKRSKNLDELRESKEGFLNNPNLYVPEFDNNCLILI